MLCFITSFLFPVILLAFPDFHTSFITKYFQAALALNKQAKVYDKSKFACQGSCPISPTLLQFITILLRKYLYRALFRQAAECT